MAVTRDDLGRAARKRGIEGQVTIIRHFGIRCIALFQLTTWVLFQTNKQQLANKLLYYKFSIIYSSSEV